MPARKDNDKGPVKRAVYLLRVSTPRQMHTATDIDPEGNSVPTQRKHCDTKCKELRAVKIDEYLEDGQSGQFLDKRPKFKKLLRRIDEQGTLITSSSTPDPGSFETTSKPRLSSSSSTSAA
jgi:hypothetical protein